MRSVVAAEPTADVASDRAVKRPPARKRAPAAPKAAAKARKRTPRPTAAPAPAPDRHRAYGLLAAGWMAIVVVAAAGGTASILLGGDGESPGTIAAGVPVTVSGEALTAFADSHEAPVYWAGGIPSRRLELTTSRAGTFVRYLPMGARAGDPRPTFATIATYPLPRAYATAARRRMQPGMTSRKIAGGGLAVWSRGRPTSVYVAFAGVPHLVEVYAPTGREAQRLSGRLRPVG